MTTKGTPGVHAMARRLQTAFGAIALNASVVLRRDRETRRYGIVVELGDAPDDTLPGADTRRAIIDAVVAWMRVSVRVERVARRARARGVRRAPRAKAPPPPPPRAAPVDPVAADLALLGLRVMPAREGLVATWRTVALRLHPDRGGSEGAFTKARDAYERLLRRCA